MVQGNYQPIELNAQGWRWSEELGLFLGVYERQLRYFTPEGEIVPIPTEQLTLEHQERELAQQQAEAERQERELAQQQLADVEALLARYQERFGKLSD